MKCLLLVENDFIVFSEFIETELQVMKTNGLPNLTNEKDDNYYSAIGNQVWYLRKISLAVRQLNENDFT